MTDERFDEPDFDDPAHAAIRELLGSAKLETPIPADVAARLDATLASLTGQPPLAEPVPDEDDPVVVPLRRRGRLGQRLLAAAAVVAVTGGAAFGLNQVLNHAGSDRSVTATSATKADSGGAEAQPQVPGATAPSDSDALTNLDGVLDSAAAAKVPVLTTADFASQTADLSLPSNRLLSLMPKNAGQSYYSARQPSASPADGNNAPGTTGSTANGLKSSSTPPRSAPEERAELARSAAKALSSCAGPKLDGTSSIPIVLDGDPAVLVVHPANAGSQLVEAWSCDGTQVLAFTTVPA
ncbi:MAG: hypothetical protein ACJ72O_10850, partial [Marmoricola sp.]